MPKLWASFLITDSVMTLLLAILSYHWTQTGNSMAVAAAGAGLFLWKWAGYRVLIRYRALVSPQLSDYMDRLQDFADQEARRMRWDAQEESDAASMGRVRPGDEL